MTCEVAAPSEETAMKKVRECLRGQAPSVRVKGMKVQRV